MINELLDRLEKLAVECHKLHEYIARDGAELAALRTKVRDLEATNSGQLKINKETHSFYEKEDRRKSEVIAELKAKLKVKVLISPEM